LRKQTAVWKSFIMNQNLRNKKGLIRASTIIPDQPEKRKVRNIFLIMLSCMSTSCNINLAQDRHERNFDYIPQIVQIVPYPDKHNYILTNQIFSVDKFYIFNNQVFHKDTNKLIFYKCIVGLIKQDQTQCKYFKTHRNFQINYIEANILLARNIPETLVTQDCNIEKCLFI